MVIVDDEDAAVEPSSYPEPDSMDEEINLPEDAPMSNPDPPHPTEPRRAVTGEKVRQSSNLLAICPRCLAEDREGRTSGVSSSYLLKLRYGRCIWCTFRTPTWSK